MKKVLTIAGSDCSGGAGIQADLKTIAMHKCYGMSVITALTAQNTLGVSGIHEVPAGFVAEQLESVFSDIFPDSVKIGMVASAEIICAIAEKLRKYGAKNIVLDPVMVSTSGSKLISDDARKALISELLPIADIITPNIPEAEVLSGMKITNEDDMKACSVKIAGITKKAVLIKGGHSVCDATDILYEGGNFIRFSAKRIQNPNTHGTGCTLSSAVSCNLAKGLCFEESIKKAKEYLTGAISAMLDLGKGAGPLDHTYLI